MQRTPADADDDRTDAENVHTLVPHTGDELNTLVRAINVGLRTDNLDTALHDARDLVDALEAQVESTLPDKAELQRVRGLIEEGTTIETIDDERTFTAIESDHYGGAERRSDRLKYEAADGSVGFMDDAEVAFLLANDWVIAPSDCPHDHTEQTETARKARPERVGAPRTVTVCHDCGDVL